MPALQDRVAYARAAVARCIEVTVTGSKRRQVEGEDEQRERLSAHAPRRTENEMVVGGEGEQTKGSPRRKICARAAPRRRAARGAAAERTTKAAVLLWEGAQEEGVRCGENR